MNIKRHMSTYVLILVFIYLSSKTGIELNLKLCEFSILVKMVFYLTNSISSTIQRDISLLFLFLSLSPSLSLEVLTHSLNLGNIKTNNLIISSKYPVKYL